MRPVVKDGLNVLTVCHGLQFGARAYVASGREVFLKGYVSTVKLLVLTSLDQLLVLTSLYQLLSILKILFTFLQSRLF